MCPLRCGRLTSSRACHLQHAAMRPLHPICQGISQAAPLSSLQAHSSPGTGTTCRPHSLPPAGLRGRCGEHLRTATPAIASQRHQPIIPDGCGDTRCTPPHTHTGHTHTPTRVIVQRGSHPASLGACRSPHRARSETNVIYTTRMQRRSKKPSQPDKQHRLA